MVSTIGVCMIVKNETAVIERCLDSMRHLADYVLIEDTGSTDGTQDKIRAWLQRNGIPGEVIEEPWRDFAYNRSHVMARLRERDHVDYAFIIDADDELEIEIGFDVAAFKAKLTADLYDVEIRHGGMRHWRPQMCSNHKTFSYKGVLHEYVEGPPNGITRETLTGIAIRISPQGARSQDPLKFQKDATLLERVLETEADPFLRSRYTFYLAQSYRDLGEREKALQAYLARADMGYWDQERFIALYEAAKLKTSLEYPFEDVIATYERAAQLCPNRAEALHGAARHCRLHGKNEEGFRFAERGLALSQPTGDLFVEPWVYGYGLLDELAVNGYWSGHHRASLDAALKLLASDKTPADQRSRILANAQASIAKLPGGLNLGSATKPDFIEQHPLTAARELRSILPDPAPRVLVAILAKQKELFLPLYLDCMEMLDYPKSSIVLYIRTNNNTDRTETILRDWLARVGHLYAAVEFDAANVDVKVEQFGAHEWNVPRFQVLGHIRNVSIERAKAHNCDFYFVADIDNFIRPCTLRELVTLNLPIVSPLLRSIAPGAFYSNYHAEIDANGYYRECDQYQWILNRWVRGIIEVPLVHCTYLIRRDILEALTYLDGSDRFEYVILSDSARILKILQYIDNRQIYGYITFGEGHEQHVPGGVENARKMIAFAGDTAAVSRRNGEIVQPDAEVHAAIIAETEAISVTHAFVTDRGERPLHTGRRAIRLKEFPPNSTLRFEPTKDYVQARNGALEKRVYLAHTDEHGFICRNNARTLTRQNIVILGDSIVESMFLDPDQRFPSCLEQILRDEYGIDVTVRNGGYSGATSLHVFNTFLNKVIPLRPDLVIWMTGVVDIDAARLNTSFWTRDCWLEPIVEIERENTWRDNEYRGQANYLDRQHLLHLACGVAQKFAIDLCFATFAHKFDDPDATAMRARTEINEVTRRTAHRNGVVLCDLETTLAHHLDIFHDAFHLNERGSAEVARELAQTILRSSQSRKFVKISSGLSTEESDEVISPTRLCNTLVFCTSFARTQDVWNTRYRRWLSAIKQSSLDFRQILIIDDGSPTVPDWPDTPVYCPSEVIPRDKQSAIVHFPDNLGRWAGHNYPGWYRSFAYAAEYATQNNFDKVVHIESDSFVLADEVFEFINATCDEWTALWDDFFEMPESAIQVAAGSGLSLYFETTRRPYSDFIHKVIEHELPFTDVSRKFYGGKFPEFLNSVPQNAQYVVQATEEYPDSYLWWISGCLNRRSSECLVNRNLTSNSAFCIDSLGIKKRLLTVAGTVVYFDQKDLVLKHGHRNEVPENVSVITVNGLAEIFILTSENQYSKLDFWAKSAGIRLDSVDGQRAPFEFRMRGVNGSIAFQSGHRYLTASCNGKIALSGRTITSEEMFQVEDHQANASPSKYSESSEKVTLETDTSAGDELFIQSAGLNTTMCEPWNSLRPYTMAVDARDLSHLGLHYITFLGVLAQSLEPQSYLEIGTASGESLKQFLCDVISIDPDLKIESNVVLARKRTFLFQMTSDEFFKSHDIRTFFPGGIDIGFLDGMHHFEFLLRDFINFERACHVGSIAVLHDCLPSDLVMTSREFRWGGWTGDVWRILLALRDYRPDLNICCVDCPPTGLVVCTSLNPKSDVLAENFDRIIAQYSCINLEGDDLIKIRQLFPYVSSVELSRESSNMRQAFGV